MPISLYSLESSVEEARASYIERHPKSRQMSQAAAQVMPGGNTRTVLYYSPFPLYFERGEGAYLWDSEGIQYLNLLGEFTAGIFGHSHPIIREAIQEALAQGINLSGHTPGEIRLAQLIHDRFPSMELMRFTNSGTEANLMAISAAKLTTGRDAVMIFSGAYHGGVLSFSAGQESLNVPFQFIKSKYNDIQTTRDLLGSHGSELACVLIEPMIGAGGCIPADIEFLKMLRSETQRCGAALIFDEVMTSRLSIGGAQALHDIHPDLTTLGKYLGGGMSFGAFGGARHLMEPFDPSRPGSVAHAGTFNNNVLSMAAGSAALERILTKDVLEKLNLRGDRLRKGLNEAFSCADVPLQATGQGSLLNIHAMRNSIRCPEDLAANNELIKELFFLDMLESGYYMARRGFIALNIEISDIEIDRFLQSVSSFLEKRHDVLVGV
jgi:glutamate-1-semialdehyde 2,1-aminomutase